MSNFPLSYKLSWLPRLLTPSLAGAPVDFGPMEQRWRQPAAVARLVFLGDISAVANREPPEIDPALRGVIAGADLVIANCESPVVERPVFPLATRLGTRHAMTPTFLDRVLAVAGIEPAQLVLSLANNHALDQGASGFDETLSVLKARGIRTIGTAADGLVRNVKAGPLTIGLLAFTQWRNAGKAEFAGRVTMADGIGGWRKNANAADLLCAVPHWDFEFRHFPQALTRALASKLARKGFGLIVGGHAHVIQPVEAIGRTLVAYGLGDFLGTVLPRQPWPLRLGAILSIEVSADEGTRGELAAYRVVPFARESHGRHERLLPIEAAKGRAAENARARLGVVFKG
ncbi:CapA family protein [Mesorhizobium sp. KR9-304]|uniref:CapA family protein n=1 Tax=Mesorhizobium sp. KR9-304 TaxID=3156614 RepID=UPI0032B5C62D